MALPKKCVLVYTLNLLCVFAALAQHKGNQIKGHINDTENHAIASASVYLLALVDSSVVKFLVTDKNGQFNFQNVDPGKYIVSVTGVGFKKIISVPIIFDGSLIVDLGIIRLPKGSTKLGEVVITANKGFADTRTDKTTLNISNSYFFTGSNALEVLNKLPGVKVDNGDNVSLNGRSDVLVTIDNKPTYLSGSALADLLRGTPGAMIDKVELISNPNSSYDAAGTGGVINIKMLRDKTMGINAQLTGGLGQAQFSGGQYSAAQNMAGINFNYRSKRLNIFGAGFYSNTPAYKLIVTDRTDTYYDKTDQIGTNLFINQRRTTNNFRIGADYTISPKQTIGFLISEVITSQNGPKNIQSTVSDHGVIDSTISTTSSLKKRQTTLGYNLNYSASISKSSQLTLNGNYINYNRAFDEYFKSDYFLSSSTTPYRTLLLQNTSPLNYDVLVFSGNYHLDVNSANNFTTGFKAGKTKMNNTSAFGTLVNNVYTPYAGFTGTFNYTESVNAAYVDYNHVFNKRTNIEFGARLEQTLAEGITSNTGEDYHNNYYGFFPNLKLNHTINSNNELQLGYGRRIYRPKYEELNPLLLYSDQYNYQIGNQYLKPYYSNLVELKHVYKNEIITALSFEAISGFSQVVYMQGNTTQVSILKKINLGNRYNYGIHFLAPVNFTKWYHVDFDVNMLYQQYTGTSVLGDLNSSSPDVTFKIFQHFKLPFGTQLDFNGYYEAPTTYGIYQYKAEYYVYGGITKSVLKKQGSVHLQVDGIFNWDKNIYTSHYQNLNLSGTQIDKFRAITLSFTYALGKKTVTAARKKSNEAAEEQGRMAGAN
ncbi:outer membrane receptor protein involved in Fe transport [Mucilaginibacter gracilis]|uniref:Outer membrane receptor protein involved in Fe transport n=1 Tax=Mucilaginibacter gracilis TaxID=423350 RepID=A0A495J9E3_9SPHI|nr:TonB-dependent receptor [Mucilaginibacter gracilis]RKR85002.1 outer membrane receptor protein involved in Fe transport [Mucilaginibacter gracilis]